MCLLSVVNIVYASKKQLLEEKLVLIIIIIITMIMVIPSVINCWFNLKCFTYIAAEFSPRKSNYCTKLSFTNYHKQINDTFK